MEYADLSKRERQVLDTLYKRGKATATEIQQLLAEELSNSTIRTILRSLEAKGFVRHGENNLRYVFEPTIPMKKMRRSVVEHFLSTFCHGSPEKAMAAILDVSDTPISPEGQQEIAALLKKVQRAERKDS